MAWEASRANAFPLLPPGEGGAKRRMRVRVRIDAAPIPNPHPPPARADLSGWER
jgi:hypothetical protein